MRTPSRPSDPLGQALFDACNVFYNIIAVESYRDYLVAMFFLKWLSDNPHAMDGKLVLPPSANFYTLFDARWQSHNAARITNAFALLESVNPARMDMLFLDVRFERLGDTQQKNALLEQLLCCFARAPLAHAKDDLAAQANIDAVFVRLIQRLDPLSQRRPGVFYTPTDVAQWMACLLEPKAGETILDPVCGIGSLPLACARVVREHADARCGLFGQEMNVRLGAIARMRMLMAGEHAHTIAAGDTIGAPQFVMDEGRFGQLRQFDIMLAHLPASGQVWGAKAARQDKFGRYERGVPPINHSEFAFILHMIASMQRDTGRMAVLVSQGVLFRAGPEAVIRRKLVQENLLDAVIGLPGWLFDYGHSDSVLLLFRHGKLDDGVLFMVAASQAGDAEQRAALLALILARYRARVSVPQCAYVAPIAEIAAHDYRLDIGRYVRGLADGRDNDLGVSRAAFDEVFDDLHDERMDDLLRKMRRF